MNPQDLNRNGALTFGLLGLAAGAVLGYLAAQAVARDPQALRAAAGRMARGAARGVEQATLAAAQAREHLADLWAEAREEARAEVDTRDFERAARATAAAATASNASTGPATGGRASRRPRTATPAASAPAAKTARRGRSRKPAVQVAAAAGPEGPGTGSD